jgi:hypothetical protein
MYLSIDQMERLGSQKRVSLYRTMRGLVDGSRPLVAKDHYGVMPGFGQLSSIYYLTKHGVKFLVEELGVDAKKIKLPKTNSKIITNDYFHRLATVDFHIEMKKQFESMEGHLIFFNRYFQRGINRKALNRIDLSTTKSFLIPDAIFKVYANSREYLFAFEVHNGNSIQKIYTQVLAHMVAIDEQAYQKRFNYKTNPRVLIQFEKESVMHGLIERLKAMKSFSKYQQLFLFSLQGTSSWQTIEKRVLLF